MSQTFPSRMDHDTAPYWQGLAEKTLRIARCHDCAHWIHPPRACCPACWSDNITREEPSGRAKLYSYLVQATEPGGPSAVVGWAELEEQEGLFIVAPIEGENSETVAIGSALTLGWAELNGSFLPVFHQGGRP